MPLEARVKSVLSGDTVVLSHVTNPAQERILSLAYVSAPRLRREGDEAFAFQSREFLRELLVGKVIQFQTLYTVPTSQREYGKIKLPSFDVTLPEISVQEGWSRVREEAGKRSDDTEETVAMLERLRALEDHARTEGKGVWAGSESGRIETSYELADGKSLVEAWKDKHLEGIVERVLTGDRLVLRLLLAEDEHLQVVVAVGGIRAPATKRVSPDGKEQPAEPYGEEAQQFVESRILQRKVQVSLLGVTPQGQLIATILHPNGNIAKFLLEAGLARVHDLHSPLLGAGIAAFRRAEKVAKDGRKGLFTNFVTSNGPAGGAALDVIVSRVLNADTIFVRNKAGQEKKISLASIRQPKPSAPEQAPFGADAKEFLRKKLIGKHVKVTIIGKKPATEGFEEREVATVMQGNTNVALALVQSGYASVIRHRQDDTDRSPDYDDLLIAEAEAQKDGKGMWSSKPPKVKQYQDYSESVQKAKMEVSILQRQKRVPAVVDFVKSGSRFTVLVPRENAKLTLVLSGIRAPRSARNPSEASEPFGQEAHDLANRRCLQRDVEIDVETIDKVGGFIGTLYVNKENFTKVLLEEGFATVHAYSAEQSGHATEYFAAEQRAKEARKGLWHDWDPSKDAEEAEEEAVSSSAAETDAAPRRKDYRDVMVTYVDPATARVKLQQIGTGTSALTELMSAFRSFHLNKSNDTPLPGPPKAGDFVAAKFTEDGEWYRAKVRRNDREKQQAEVVYIDYGNSEVLPWSRLRPLSQPQFSAQKLRPQAVDAALSILQFPASPDYLQDAVSFLEEQTFNRELVANVDFVSAEGTLHVTLLDPSESKNLDQSINAEIVREGLAMVPRKLKAWERAAGETLSNLRTLEDEAKQQRRGMWEYGDLTED
ncbi:putative transcription factor (Snd1/p100) [Aspergillus lucknowensis]|uniref:Probable endonuclease LCL3 n=1 Tax=Aspergillus lucknowensis TaxID=176173 RepID=A0ABR4L9P0_9EURO